MAYSAKLDGEFIGMAQFTIEAKRGRIRNIVTVEGVDDFEALFLMGRAALNFIDLCGIHTAVCDETAATPRVITAVGFKRAENGSLLADMTHMFGGCEDKH
jgi:hypothetical protein